MGGSGAGAGGRRGAPSLSLVAVAAIAAGAGVVFAMPPKVDEMQVGKRSFGSVDMTHPDPISHQFNPRTRAGKGLASIELRFVYRVRQDQERAAAQQIAQNWLFANSNVLVLLKSLSWEELSSESAGQMLERAVIDELDRTLFPTVAGRKLARVTRVVWTKWLMQ
jgi:hypothetical protein